MAMQRTLVLLKPDAVQRGLVGELISRLERKGLLAIGMRMLVPSATTATQHYQEHAQKPFFPSLLKFITSGPLVALALEGDEAVTVVRNLVGATDGRKAAPGTIRGDFSISRSANLVHGSDSPEAAEREMKIWFPEGFVTWSRCDKPWLDAE
ncbi:MAG TPA: nucleoside-diphosphate kinase [Planctomycetota bacterium]|nr:nucleoside-diphosphate kinase [Planctomycetota bacterium]